VGRVARSVIATGYGLEGPGSNPGGGARFSVPVQTGRGPPSLLYNGYRVFPGGKEWPVRDADPSPPSGAVVKKEQSYTSNPRTAFTESQCLYVQGCTLPLPYLS